METSHTFAIRRAYDGREVWLFLRWCYQQWTTNSAELKQRPCWKGYLHKINVRDIFLGAPFPHGAGRFLHWLR